MPRADFAAALRELDERLAERGMPPSADRRVRERLRLAGEARRRLARQLAHARPRRRRLLGVSRPWLGVPALACVAVLVLGVVIGLRGRAGDSMSLAPTEVAGFVLVAGSPDLDLASVDGALELRRGRCTLRDATAAMTLEVDGAAKVRRQPGGVTVERGTVSFSADPSGEPRRVTVSHGEIHITGTRFTVVQTAEGGSVALHEGAIVFESSQRADARVSVRPGETLAWPMPQPASQEEAADPTPRAASGELPAPSTTAGARAPSSSRAPPAAAPARSADGADVLERIEALRSQGRYAEAAELAASAPSSSAATRERLSYERGGLLTHQLADRDRACQHWRRHASEFPGGRYAVEVQRARAHLGCP